MNTLYTWGYQSRSIQDLKDIIAPHWPVLIVDVRARPWSRYQPEFRKEALSKEFGPGGLYIHPDYLGNQHRALPWKRHPEWESDVKEAAHKLRQHCHCLLLCLERDPNRCHRSDVARAIQDMCGCKVEHLGWPPRVKEPAKAPKPQAKQLELF